MTELGEFDLFISWSGPRASAVAQRLAEWLPVIVPGIMPFISQAIEPGKLWEKVVIEKLKAAKYAILCITPENQNAEWIHFEAGALLNGPLGDRDVCPLLIDLSPGRLKGPISGLQAHTFDEQGLLNVCQSLARRLGAVDAHVVRACKAAWPRIKRVVNADFKKLCKPVASGPKALDDESALRIIRMHQANIVFRVMEEVDSVIQSLERSAIVEIDDIIIKLRTVILECRALCEGFHHHTLGKLTMYFDQRYKAEDLKKTVESKLAPLLFEQNTDSFMKHMRAAALLRCIQEELLIQIQKDMQV